MSAPDYEITDDPARIDFAAVHQWLASTYWSPNVSRDLVERAARHSSLVIGAYLGTQQVAYCRIVSDRTTFAWVSDVFVHPDHRGKGLGREMVKFALNHPEHKGLRRWMLATRDAHEVYAAIGFTLLDDPKDTMVYRPVAGWDTPGG